MLYDKVDVSVHEIYERDSDVVLKRLEDATGSKRPVAEIFKTHNQISPSLMQC